MQVMASSQWTFGVAASVPGAETISGGAPAGEFATALLGAVCDSGQADAEPQGPPAVPTPVSATAPQERSVPAGMIAFPSADPPSHDSDAAETDDGDASAVGKASEKQEQTGHDAPENRSVPEGVKVARIAGQVAIALSPAEVLPAAARPPSRRPEEPRSRDRDEMSSSVSRQPLANRTAASLPTLRSAPQTRVQWPETLTTSTGAAPAAPPQALLLAESPAVSHPQWPLRPPPPSEPTNPSALTRLSGTASGPEDSQVDGQGEMPGAYLPAQQLQKPSRDLTSTAGPGGAGMAQTLSPHPARAADPLPLDHVPAVAETRTRRLPAADGPRVAVSGADSPRVDASARRAEAMNVPRESLRRMDPGDLPASALEPAAVRVGASVSLNRGAEAAHRTQQAPPQSGPAATVQANPRAQPLPNAPLSPDEAGPRVGPLADTPFAAWPTPTMASAEGPAGLGAPPDLPAPPVPDARTDNSQAPPRKENNQTRGFAPAKRAALEKVLGPVPHGVTPEPPPTAAARPPRVAEAMQPTAPVHDPWGASGTAEVSDPGTRRSVSADPGPADMVGRPADPAPLAQGPLLAGPPSGRSPEVGPRDVQARSTAEPAGGAAGMGPVNDAALDVPAGAAERVRVDEGSMSVSSFRPEPHSLASPPSQPPAARVEGARGATIYAQQVLADRVLFPAKRNEVQVPPMAEVGGEVAWRQEGLPARATQADAPDSSVRPVISPPAPAVSEVQTSGASSARSAAGTPPRAPDAVHPASRVPALAVASEPQVRPPAHADRRSPRPQAQLSEAAAATQAPVAMEPVAEEAAAPRSIPVEAAQRLRELLSRPEGRQRGRLELQVDWDDLGVERVAVQWQGDQARVDVNCHTHAAAQALRPAEALLRQRLADMGVELRELRTFCDAGGGQPSAHGGADGWRTPQRWQSYGTVVPLARQTTGSAVKSRGRGVDVWV